MRLRNLKNKDDLINNCEYLISDPFSLKGKWNTLFNNNNPIHIEIGMGKGSFIKGMAKAFPNINFIGIEKFDGVVARAINNINSEEEIPNLRIIKIDAINVKDIFDKEISTIYLNFSDPWPKKRQVKRRLTSEIFLNAYEGIFKGERTIIMKTDNIGLFGYSLSSLSKFGYTLEDVSLDLHSRDDFNVETEYEKKFSSQGVKINYLKAIKK